MIEHMGARRGAGPPRRLGPRAGFIACAAVLLAACLSRDAPSLALAEVEVGTGALSFAPIVDGSSVAMVCGPQGGQHLWVSVRARALDPRAVVLTLELRLLGSGQLVCARRFEGLPLLPSGEWWDYTGIACFVTSPDDLRNRTVSLSAQVDDTRGRRGAARRSFVILEPPDLCNSR